jgi:hypothetical protein
VKRPDWFVTSSSETFVPSLVMTTVAPGTMAFWGSVTVPVMVADRICAPAAEAQNTLASTSAEQNRCLITTPPLRSRGA